jgi:hypothetical protein
MYTDDLVDILEDAIRMLYVISGRTFQFSDDKFKDVMTVEIPPEEEGGEPAYEEVEGVFFEDDLALDEQEWVLLEGEIAFYNLALSNVDDLQSYTTDAMAVTHGDKPYKNIKQTLDVRKAKQDVVWTRVVRFNQLGVSG